jgi:Ca-activated chloride channel family protein
MRALLLLLSIAGSAACQQASFKVDVNLVTVAFTVRDSTGALAGNLTKDDFEVLEDGAPQKISFFARSLDIPLTIGLIADFSGSQSPFIKQHHKDLQEFLRSVVRQQDQGFLIVFGNYLRLASDFTGSVDALMQALNRAEQRELDFPEIGPAERRSAGTAFYDAIYHTCNELLSNTTMRRRALIVFSDGEDNSSAHHMLDAIEAAQNSDAAVFAIRYTDVPRGGPNSRNKYGTSVMARVAKETGGADFDAGRADLRAAFRQIGEELRSSYELAYASTNPERDGLFRKVVIRSKKPGLTVRAKTGYYAR